MTKEQGIRTTWMIDHPTGLNGAHGPVSPNRLIPIGQIHIDAANRFHKLDDDVVKGLVESIKVNGLITPITLTPEVKGDAFGYRLIAGHHRVEAARKLLWNEIPAQVKPYLDADDTALAEIDDNLVRGELDFTERAKHIDARVEIHNRKYAAELEAQRVAQVAAAAEARRIVKTVSGDLPKTIEPSRVLTGIAQTAKDTGIDVSQVERAVKAVKIIPDIGRISKTSLDKDEEVRALVKLVKVAPDRAEALIVQAQASPKDKTISARHIYSEVQEVKLNPKTERLLVTLLYHMRNSETDAGRQIVFDRVREVYEHPQGNAFDVAQKKAHDEIRGLAKAREGK